MKTLKPTKELCDVGARAAKKLKALQKRRAKKEELEAQESEEQDLSEESDSGVPKYSLQHIVHGCTVMSMLRVVLVEQKLLVL